MARAHIEFNSSELHRNLRNMDRKVENAVAAVVEYHSSKGESQMKVNAPWSDRTGAARTGLHTATSHEVGTHTIIFAHSVPYGIWLEVKNSGRYEVIMPTVRDTGAQLMQSLNGLLGRMQ